jgi:DNA-directed RNA polymerase subunit RPC12/RpoP
MNNNLVKRKKLPCPECNSKWTYWRVYGEHYICRACGNEFQPYEEIDGTANTNPG